MIMKKVLYFILLCMAVVGILGGIGYTAYYGVYPIAICLLASGYVCYPGIKDLFNELKK